MYNLFKRKLQTLDKNASEISEALKSGRQLAKFIRNYLFVNKLRLMDALGSLQTHWIEELDGRYKI